METDAYFTLLGLFYAFYEGIKWILFDTWVGTFILILFGFWYVKDIFKGVIYEVRYAVREEVQKQMVELYKALQLFNKAEEVRKRIKEDRDNK